MIIKKIKLKFKNKSSIKKRCFIKNKNNFFRAKAFKRHILINKSKNRKRKLKKIILINKSNIKVFKKLFKK